MTEPLRRRFSVPLFIFPAVISAPTALEALPSPLGHRRRRVLVVTPNFAPVSAVDYQRIRQALPHLAAGDWEAEILTVDPQHIEHSQDPHLLQTLPIDLKIHRVGALPQRWTRPWGLGNLGWRAWPFLAAEGDRLLRQQSFDLVFFSTTVFPCLLLGPRWRRKFGLPYVIDFQDPWRVDQQQQQQRAKQRPGGRLKYALDKSLARWLEPGVVNQAAQIIAVSPHYIDQLQVHYPSLAPERCRVITFGAPAQDFEQLPQLQSKTGLQQQIFDPEDGDRHWVYVGRGGDDLLPAVQQLFRAIAGDRRVHPQRWQGLKLHFVGTSYAPEDLAQPSFLALAEQFGLGDLVHEVPQRVPYFEALQLLAQSDAILLLGSRDPGYSPSKIYPCLLAAKPLLALMPGNSPVKPLLQQAQPEAWVELSSAEFSDPAANSPESANSSQSAHSPDHPPSDCPLHRRLEQLLKGDGLDPEPLQLAIHPYRPANLTAQLVEVFQQALEQSDS